VGLVGGVAQWMLTEAWASAQVSSVAPYSYPTFCNGPPEVNPLER